jgi:hypothetical protein
MFEYNLIENGGITPEIPDGVHYGVWNASGTYILEFPDIKLIPDYESKEMIPSDPNFINATFLVFKPFWLVIKKKRTLTFPFELTFENGMLVKVDGETKLVGVFPKNLDDYQKINEETLKKFFIIT